MHGFVVGDDRSTPLTACWSKGSHGRYPFYLCPKRGCESCGKSIRRDKLEGDFENLLHRVQPSENVFRLARAVFTEMWNRGLAKGKAQAKAMGADIVRVERELQKLLERIADASVPTLVIYGLRVV